jgi:hypothetical protein
MLNDAFLRFCLSHPTTVLVPAEMFEAGGVRSDFVEALAGDGRVPLHQLHRLGAGFVLYQQRCRDLFARAPNAWFPPRKVNVFIAVAPRSVVPYLDALAGSSVLLYASDLDADPEYIAFLLVQAERLALVRSVRAATAMNLSYWFDRNDAEKQAFADAARAATRPDARAYALIADAFEWLGELLHNPLRQPAVALSEPYAEVQGADLFVPVRLQAELMRLCEQAETAVAAALSEAVPARVKASRTSVDAVCDWLRDTRPRLIVASPKGKTLWNPDKKDASAVRDALAEANDEAVASMHADFRLAHQRTRQFFDCTLEPESLPRQCGVLESDTGIYVDAARHVIVYRLMQENFDPRQVPAPPMHRLLVGVRVMHEWGHLAHTAKYMRVPEARKAEYREARAELGQQFYRIAATAPEHVRNVVDEELRSMAPRAEDAPAALAKRTLGRVGDYLCNFMCSKLLPHEEMQAYIRLNVRHHLDENLPPLSELARYAYEIHYLALAGLERSYFMDTTRFPDLFVASGIVSEDDAHALFDTVGRVLACYEIDPSKLAIPAATPH